MSALPIHPVVNPFPIAATVLAALALLAAGLRPRDQRREWLTRCLLLLLVALAALPAVAWSGRLWAAAMGVWPASRALPPSRALGGLLRLHLEGAAGSTGLLLAGLLLVHRHRRGQGRLWPALLVVLAAAAAVGVTAHLGGMMAFGEPGAPG